MASREIAKEKGIDLLKRVSTQYGFMASATNVDNYGRVWARDGVVCGLAALLTGENELIATFKSNLENLAKFQGELGQIPSNVKIDIETPRPSYGGLCGRVDTIPWFVIGVCNYAHFTNDTEFAYWMLPIMEKGLKLLTAWEFNNKGLVYVPRSGNWADEYILHGYILYDQLLRYWALKAFANFFNDELVARKAQELKALIERNYWLNREEEKLYHKQAMKLIAQKNLPYWLPAFNPGGYQMQFDAWANALALLLEIGTLQQRNQLFDYTSQLMNDQTLALLPAFWPVIDESAADWQLLLRNNSYHFKNYPYEFHNGGSWSVINGFLGAAFCNNGWDKDAQQLLDAMNIANRKSNEKEEWGFYENFHTQTGEPKGTKYCAWSAAGAIITHEYIAGKHLLGA